MPDALGLPHLADGLDQLAHREELAVRDGCRFLLFSKLSRHKTLDDYDFSFRPGLDPRKVKDMATLSFVEAKANAALLGARGVGRTHTAVALAAVVQEPVASIRDHR